MSKNFDTVYLSQIRMLSKGDSITVKWPRNILRGPKNETYTIIDIEKCRERSSGVLACQFCPGRMSFDQPHLYHLCMGLSKSPYFSIIINDNYNNEINKLFDDFVKGL